MKREELQVRLQLAQGTNQQRQQDSVTRTAVSLMQHDAKEKQSLDSSKPKK